LGLKAKPLKDGEIGTKDNPELYSRQDVAYEFIIFLHDFLWR
jgi:hypothetical protein